MRTTVWINTLLLLCLALAAASCQDRAGGAALGSQSPPNAALQTFVDGKGLNAAISAPQMTDAERARLADQVRRVYADQRYHLIWIDDDRLSARYHTFSKALAAAVDHGLPRSLYPLPIDAKLQRMRAGKIGNDVLHLDPIFASIRRACT